MPRKMKESGVEWLGQIPEGWGLGRIGALYSLRNEKVSDKDFPPLSVTMKGIVPQLETAAKTDDGDNRKLVRKGDFAINSRSDRRGSCGISAYDGSVSLINTILTPRGAMSPAYYNWLFHTTSFADEFYKWGHGIVDDLWTTRWDDMKRIAIPTPPYSEQERIAAFLDERCAKIDGMIAEAKASIEDYKKWKQSIIFEAVTGKHEKNLKPSGVDWIGDVPEGWKVVPLRYLGECANGISKGGEFFGSGCPFVSYSDVYKNDWLPDRVNGLVQSTAEERERYSVEKGDVFFTRTSETIDELGMASACLTTIKDAVFAGFLIRFRPLKKALSVEFSKYYFKHPGLRVYFTKEAMLVTRASLSQELLKNMPVLIPPLPDQRRIAAELDEKCAAIDKLVGEKEALITDLEAYKKSLIFETVTGKREVA